jgi:hypothetical protein
VNDANTQAWRDRLLTIVVTVLLVGGGFWAGRLTATAPAAAPPASGSAPQAVSTPPLSARALDSESSATATRVPDAPLRPAEAAETTGAGESADSERSLRETVFITRTGKRYHRDGCSSLSKSRIPVTLTEAAERGLTPCSRCW